MSVSSSTWHFARIMLIAIGRIFVNFRIRHFLLSLPRHYDFGLNRTKITTHTWRSMFNHDILRLRVSFSVRYELDSKTSLTVETKESRHIQS